MITIAQCRAARGLLNWTQQDLADAAGLSKTAINNFEKGNADTKIESLKAVQRAFERLDIEFIGRNGLRKRTDEVRTLKGTGAFEIFLEDIYKTLKSCHSELLINVVNTECKLYSLTELSRWQALFKALAVKERALRPQGKDYCRLTPGGQQLRHAVNVQNTGPDIFLYGPKTGLIFNAQPLIVIINNQVLTDTERSRFEALWQNRYNAQTSTTL